MSTLFHHDITVAVLGSGSSGNTTYIGDGHQGLLIDCGLSTKQIHARMAAVGLEGAPIDAVLITHEHSDHVGAAAVLDRSLYKRTGRHIPFHMTLGTRNGLNRKVVPTNRQRVHAGQAFALGDWRIEPFSVPHDTPDPVAYAIQIGSARVGVVTDLGSRTHLVTKQLASLDIAVVEFNHDEEMLRDGAYPWQLKERIHGRLGHLSNRVASDMLTDALSAGRLKHVVLAHLSDDNNSPEKALRAAEAARDRAGVGDVTIGVGKKREAIAPRRLTVPWSAPEDTKPARIKRTTQDRVAIPEQQSLFG